MASSTEQLIFEILAKDAAASAAFDRFRGKVDQTSRSVDANSKSLDDNTRSTDKNKDSQRDWLQAAGGVALAFAPIAGGAAAAGAGVAAMSALAVPSIRKIDAALTGQGGLSASWATLDNRQRNAALSVQALGQDYSGLARQLEPQVFQDFNQGLGIANKLLGPTGQLAHSAGQGVSDFLAQFAGDSDLNQFITYLSTVARPAIGLVGSDLTHTAHLVFSLLQSFGGTGMVELRALTGGFTALDDSVSFLDQHAPGLTSAGLAVGGIALALSKLNLLSGALKITGISNIASQMTGFAGATKGATLAEKGLLATTTALEAISPWAWVGLGVVALGGLAFAIATYKGSINDVIAEQARQDKATGFNIAGWDRLSDSLGKASRNYDYIAQHFRLGRGNIGGVTDEVDQLTGAQQKYEDNTQVLVSWLQKLGDRYGLTQQQAIRLAEASGVQVDKNAKLVGGFAAATRKADAYADASRSAQTPVTQLASDISDFSNKTLTATQRETALSDALKLFFDPALQADQDLVTLKGDQVALAAALQASAGKTELLTGKQGAAHQAFDTYIGQVRQAANDAFTATHNQSSYNQIISDSLPILNAAAKGNKGLELLVHDLIETMKGLTPEKVRISVGATGTWQVTQGPGGPQVHVPGAAAGMFVGQGRQGVDDQLILAQRGELVVPTSIVSSGAVDHLRGSIPGFADGGVVGSYGGAVPGLGMWLKSEDAATLLAIESSVAAATLAGIKAAQKSAIGPANGNAIFRYAETFLGDPYVWGATGPVAHDCSGLTMQVYRHFGINGIPRTSQQQQVWAQPSADRAGALVFFYGTGGTATHVGISDGTGKMVNAANPAVGTVISSTAGNTGFGVPPAVSFDAGGDLAPGFTLAYNGTGRPERVGSAGNHYHITVQVAPGASLAETGRAVVGAIRAFEAKSGKGWRS